MSRRTLARAALRMGGITLLTLWPCFAGLRSLATGLDLLITFGTAGSVFCAFVALALREPFAAGGLNHWDEALAYVAFARIMHFAHGLQG